jgi:hypothetical protein
MRFSSWRIPELRKCTTWGQLVRYSKLGAAFVDRLSLPSRFYQVLLMRFGSGLCSIYPNTEVL